MHCPTQFYLTTVTQSEAQHFCYFNRTNVLCTLYVRAGLRDWSQYSVLQYCCHAYLLWDESRLCMHNNIGV